MVNEKIYATITTQRTFEADGGQTSLTTGCILHRVWCGHAACCMRGITFLQKHEIPEVVITLWWHSWTWSHKPSCRPGVDIWEGKTIPYRIISVCKDPQLPFLCRAAEHAHWIWNTYICCFLFQRPVKAVESPNSMTSMSDLCSRIHTEQSLHRALWKNKTTMGIARRQPHKSRCGGAGVRHSTVSALAWGSTQSALKQNWAWLYYISYSSFLPGKSITEKELA